MGCLGEKLIIGAIGFVILALFLVVGPKGCARQVTSWKASSYGADWLVVQYSQNGDVINYWELANKSVGNEEYSDGIYFTDNNNNVTHLSGHYVYIQIKGNVGDLKTRYLK